MCPFCLNTDHADMSQGRCRCKGEVKNLPFPSVSCNNTVQRFTILQWKFGCWHCLKIYNSQYDYENYDQIVYAWAHNYRWRPWEDRVHHEGRFSDNLNKESQTREKDIIREKEETVRQFLTKTARENNNEEDIDAGIIKHNFLTHFQHLPFPQHFPFNIKLPKRYCLEKGCIIDLETTSFSPWSGHIITMGILEKDRAIVHQLTVPKYKDFQVYCFKKARETQEPRYAYNARFESEFLQIENGWRDLMQYRVVDLSLVRARGLEISKAKESQIRRIDSFNYKVYSQNSDRWYAVHLSGGNWSCECPFYNRYFEKCKHIWAVEFSFKANMEQVKRNNMIIKIPKSLGQCTSSAFKEPAIRGRDVPQIWQQWLNTNKPEILANIALHCLSDLLRERQLVKE